AYPARSVSPLCAAAPSSANTPSFWPAPASASNSPTRPRTARSSPMARCGPRCGAKAGRPAITPWPMFSASPICRVKFMQRILVLVRHGQSDWNLKNLFTGWKDPDLTELGVQEAHDAGKALKAAGYSFDLAYTSELSRARRTLDIILQELGQTDLPIIRDIALNERGYGDLSGLSKGEAAKNWGEAQVHAWRRSYDVAPPGGESLRDTLARVLPYYV